MSRILRIPAAALAACLLILSCALGSREARTMLTAADSLMGTDPQAALYSIMSIDSSAVLSMNNKDRALYILLRT